MKVYLLSSYWQYWWNNLFEIKFWWKNMHQISSSLVLLLHKLSYTPHGMQSFLSILPLKLSPIAALQSRLTISEHSSFKCKCLTSYYRSLTSFPTYNFKRKIKTKTALPSKVNKNKVIHKSYENVFITKNWLKEQIMHHSQTIYNWRKSNESQGCQGKVKIPPSARW